jgi:hypothetical protein
MVFANCLGAVYCSEAVSKTILETALYVNVKHVGEKRIFIGVF